jgi:hypothetical protein
MVSLEYVRKIREQPLRTGQMERAAWMERWWCGTGAEHTGEGGRADLSDPGRVAAPVWQQAMTQLSRSLTWLMLKRLGSGLKKSLRRARHGSQPQAPRIRTVPRDKRIFLDESGVTIGRTRHLWARHARPTPPESTPGGHRKVLTILGAMSLDGMIRRHNHRSRTNAEIFLAAPQKLSTAPSQTPSYASQPKRRPPDSDSTTTGCSYLESTLMSASTVPPSSSKKPRNREAFCERNTSLPMG